MGFLLTLLYVVLNHLSPADTFPSWTPYHSMLWLGLLTVAVSIPLIAIGRFPFRAPQVYLMVGLIAAVGLSRIANHLYREVLPGLEDFITAGIVFYLVIANFTTIRRLRVLAGAMVLVALYLLSRAVFAYHFSDSPSPFLLVRTIGESQVAEQAGGVFARIRALGFLHDPNDFGQYLVISLPLLAFAWRPQRPLRNLLAVLLPTCFLLYGSYLTHSRGAFVGLLVVLWFALKRYLNRFGALIITLILMVLLVTTISGGRETSIAEASGRFMAWGAGLGMLKSSPVFGVGFDGFQERYEHTAHNSFVLCFAELGLFGYFFWLGLIVYTLLDLNSLLGSIPENEENSVLLRCARLLRVTFVAFLASACFLSRTYIMTFYLLVGMAVATIGLLKQQPLAIDCRTGSGWKLTLACEVVSIGVVYAIVLSRSLF